MAWYTRTDREITVDVDDASAITGGNTLSDVCTDVEAGNTLLTSIESDTTVVITRVTSIESDTTAILAMNTKIESDTTVVATNSANLATILAALSPVIVTPVASDQTSDSWTYITIPANASYAHAAIETIDAFVCPTVGATVPAADGCSYKINGVYKIDCRGYNDGSGRFHHKRDGASNGVIKVTFFLTA